MTDKSPGVLGVSLLAMFVFSPALAGDQEFTRQALIEDTRQLVDAIESAHPDPYLRGGGKVAFHRRFQELLESIPDQGLILSQFAERLQTFVCAIGDGHTAVRAGDSPDLLVPSRGLPFVFGVIEDWLYVKGVYDPADLDLIGARLVSVQGVPFNELLARQRRIRAVENRPHNLMLLGLGLAKREILGSLVPEWQDHSTLRMVLKAGDGRETEHALPVLDETDRKARCASSRIELPSTGKSEMAWEVMVGKQVALLRIDGMMGYREAFESFLARGMSEVETYARAAYKKAHLREAPEKIAEVVAGLPSATETFRALVHAMKTAGTQALVIDLRDNTGGNSLMKEILAYFLYGQEALDSLDNGYQIVKYSELYYSVYASDSLEKVNAGRRTALTRGDYDLREERARNQGPRKGGWLEAVKDSATFMNEYRTGTHHTPGFRPGAVFVLSTPLTYSSGFNMLRDLYALGAIVVGTPSAQPGNNFGDSLPFKLRHTGLSVFVSHKLNIAFPNEPERGTCLMPHHLLTYEKLSALRFDPNAEVLLALELAEAGKGPNLRLP